MSANVKTADLAITIVVTLLKAAGLGPEADRILDAIEGAKSCIGLIDDIKNEIVSDPNKDLIRSLFKTMEEEVRSIKADLKEQGLGIDEIESTTDALIETTRLTVKQLAQDDDALLDAARLPDSFFKILVHRAEPLPDWCDDTIGKLYEQLLKRVSAEFIERAKDFDRFDKVALASLLRDNLSAKKQRNRIERGVQENRAINLETNRVVKEDRATGLETNQLVKELVQRHPYSIPSRLILGSRPDVVTGDHFIPRREQEQLNSLIADPTRTRTVLVGMRGCGKTQLAASLAKQCEDANWKLVAWINAVSRESIQSDLVELAKELKIDTNDEPTREQLIARCLNSLRSSEASNRLIIFDNVEDINDLRGLVPTGDGLRVVATTTNDKGWNYHGWDAIRIEVFDRKKSIDYLLTVTESVDRAAADTLADRLGDLPLALAQAAATAHNGDLSLARYLHRLDSYGSERAIRPVPGDYYADDVATTLCMAIEDALENLADPTRRYARRQLGALALLAESGVPTRWLDPTIEQQDNQELQDADQAEDEDAHDALTELIHRSIVQQSSDKATTLLHRLQAQAFRESWSENEAAEAYESAAILLGKVDVDSFPRNETDARRRETLDLIEQLRAVGEQKYSRNIFAHENVPVSIVEALSNAHDLALFSEALTLEASVNTIQEILGPEHPDTLTVLNGFGAAHLDMQLNTEAIAIFERLLSVDRRYLDENNPTLFASQNNLASAYQQAGRLRDAITLYEAALVDHTRMTTPSYPDTLTALSNLAAAYQAEDRPEEASELFDTVLDEQLHILGPDHPNTLRTRSHIAKSYFAAGLLAETTELYEHLLADSIRILGETHPDTLTYSGNLAKAYETAGHIDEAIPLFEKTLKFGIEIFGRDHPKTIALHDNLARAYCAVGNFSQSIGLYKQLINNTIQRKGEDAPDTLTVRNDLAYTYAMAGRNNIAASLFMQVLEDRTRVLGHDHPDTLAARNNLIAPFLTTQRPAQAVELLEDLLKDCLRILGTEHPLTKTVRENLEAARRELEQQEKETPAE